MATKMKTTDRNANTIRPKERCETAQAARQTLQFTATNAWGSWNATPID
jgi:hypothetical protein